LPLSVAIKRRVEICSDLNNILVAMKEETTEIESFNNMVNKFKNMYAIAERKIKLTNDEKKVLILKQNNICPLCKAAIYLTDDIAVDHILPIAVQGPDEKENLQLVHKLCNEKKWCKTSN
jgi:5-methylcytosine-specific restriction endonuclease McrA